MSLEKLQSIKMKQDKTDLLDHSEVFNPYKVNTFFHSSFMWQ